MLQDTTERGKAAKLKVSKRMQDPTYVVKSSKQSFPHPHPTLPRQGGGNHGLNLNLEPYTLNYFHPPWRPYFLIL